MPQRMRTIEAEELQEISGAMGMLADLLSRAGVVELTIKGREVEWDTQGGLVVPEEISPLCDWIENRYIDILQGG